MLDGASTAAFLQAGVRLCAKFGIPSQCRGCGFLLIQPSPSGIALCFQFLPARNVFFCVILLIVGLAELSGVEEHVSLPSWAGFAELIWKTPGTYASFFFVQQVFLLD